VIAAWPSSSTQSTSRHWREEQESPSKALLYIHIQHCLVRLGKPCGIHYKQITIEQLVLDISEGEQLSSAATDV